MIPQSDLIRSVMEGLGYQGRIYQRQRPVRERARAIRPVSEAERAVLEMHSRGETIGYRGLAVEEASSIRELGGRLEVPKWPL